MADEYIRRVEAEEAIEEYCCRMCADYSQYEGGCVSHAQHCPHLSGEEILKPVKATDVQPVRRGEWEEIEDIDGDSHYGCSACGAEFYLEAGTPSDNEYYYCPFCGADMRNPETIKG